MINASFRCPFCSHMTTITEPNYFEDWQKIKIQKSKIGEVGIYVQAVTCPNPDCSELWLKLELKNAHQNVYHNWGAGKIICDWQLLPESEAKVLPHYIPSPIKKDYLEACRIRDLSPNASATLARRCIQGMIRDFWKVSKNTLYKEIEAIKDKVHHDTWESIDTVRQFGNIGAHMEEDIDLIIDVEPQEAKLLIRLIEDLVDDWYVDLENRKKRQESLKESIRTKKSRKIKNLKRIHKNGT